MVYRTARLLVFVITFVALDPQTATPAHWSAFHAVRRVLATEEEPDLPVPQDVAVEARLREPDPQWAVRWWIAFDGGEPVGRVQLATRGGEDPRRYAGRVFVTGGVLPNRRRQGIGTHMARHLARVMTDEAHEIAVFPLSNLQPGGAFVERLGAALVYREVDNRLPLANADVATLRTYIDAVPPSLRWEVHRERVPIARLHQLAPQMDMLLADVPRQGLSLPPPLFEVSTYEALYRRLDSDGGAHVLVLLLAGEDLASVSETIVAGDSPDVALQNFTGVARHWRGRRLGLAAKARTLQLLGDRRPVIRTVRTRNAANNIPMLRLNAQIGFNVFRESGVYEISSPVLARTL
jgi:GNAT superfamily N-acetyltransferase